MKNTTSSPDAGGDDGRHHQQSTYIQPCRELRSSRSLGVYRCSSRRSGSALTDAAKSGGQVQLRHPHCRLHRCSPKCPPTPANRLNPWRAGDDVKTQLTLTYRLRLSSGTPSRWQMAHQCSTTMPSDPGRTGSHGHASQLVVGAGNTAYRFSLSGRRTRLGALHVGAVYALKMVHRCSSTCPPVPGVQIQDRLGTAQRTARPVLRRTGSAQFGVQPARADR
jgi:hypothetical protein